MAMDTDIHITATHITTTIIRIMAMAGDADTLIMDTIIIGMGITMVITMGITMGRMDTIHTGMLRNMDTGVR